MNTFLGAAQLLPVAALDEAQIEGAAILYLEGYLWDPETPRYAMIKAIDVARAGGPQGRLHPLRHLLHRPPPRRLQRADRRRPDRHPLRQRGRDPGARRRSRISKARSRRSRTRCETLVVTRSEKGAIAIAGRRARRGRRPSRSQRWSTRPAPATCSPPASSPARRRGRSLERSLRHRRDRRGRGDLALRRAARGGPQGAGGGAARLGGRRRNRRRGRAAPGMSTSGAGGATSGGGWVGCGGISGGGWVAMMRERLTGP